ncbi:TonB-dependent receptor [Aestuariivivens insulae]|uniref:TonB-dependent receptor n=1 Tax=Aestuariivivens insulae TaxID=1621988 RepID=UPI001F594EA2|nr:TonB-dependent receptor [Aestuariivivens insulae]
MRHFILLLALLIASFSSAQNTGTIAGKLTDKEFNNEPLAFANVLIKGTTKGTTSDFDGLYGFENLEPGSYTLVYSFVGYETREINVAVVAGKVSEVNVTMAASAASLDEVVITTTTKRESETALLLEQKKAVGFKTAIGSDELSRKGVGDVATAVTKVTGISKQEGSGNIFVRGLGDRYNITTLNGLPLPSNNPSNKNIDLDIFSTDIVGSIDIDKTYDTKNYGDFAGANINIASKNYTGKGMAEIQLESGVSTNAISQKDFYLNDGPNQTGFYSKTYPAFPLNNYNFTTSWDREKVGTPINSGASLKLGDSYVINDDTKINFFGVASFNNDYDYKEGISRGSVNVSGVPRKDYTFSSYSYNTNTTLMGNAGIKFKDHKLKYNGLYVNTSSQDQDEYFGTVDAFDYAPEGGAFLQRQTFERTQLVVHQILGDHEIGESFEINWGASYNFVKNNIPNRRQNILTPNNWDDPEGPKSFLQTNNASDNHRFYQDLEEEEIAANFSASYHFNKDEEDSYKGKITVGYSGRFKNVDFDATQFNFRINRKVSQPLISDIYNLDSYFNQNNLNAGLFSIETFRGNASITNALDPQTFDGPQDIHAAFLSLEYALTPKLTMLVGVRGEKISQTINWNTSLSAGSSVLDETEILPSLSLKYQLNDKQNLKLAASKTYTLPQYIERAFFQFVGATQSFIGNPSLYASTDYNADLKWEIFPKNGELISIGAFGKYIQDPINESIINSASNDISYVNSGDWALAIGGEFEARKNIFESDDELKNDFSVGVNASYMYTNQELDKDKVIEETTAAGSPISVDFTNKEDKLSGASDLLLNADLTYTKEYKNDKSIQTTIAYNYFSDRVFALGTEGKGDLIDKGIGTLDFVFKSKLNKNLGVNLSAKNLLNPTIERHQEVQNVLVSSYKRGVNLKLSLIYSF